MEQMIESPDNFRSKELKKFRKKDINLLIQTVPQKVNGSGNYPAVDMSLRKDHQLHWISALYVQ